MNSQKFKASGWNVVKYTSAKIGLVALLVLVSIACERGDTSTASEESVEVSGEEYHSPFVVTGEGDLSFETITFTDVGLSAPESGPVDQIVLEAIAESVAYELADHKDLVFDPQVEYDEAMTDPDNHLYCDSNHLYVALWRGYEPDRWGYSLWSGCHEAQQFEWKEIEDPFADTVDPVTWVEPLTESIVNSIDDAHVKDCFVAEC